MSKLNVGVGEDFPLDDKATENEREHVCAHYWRHRREGRGRHYHPLHAAGAIVVIPAGVAAVTTAILYPLTTLGIIGGLGLAAAAHRRGRWARYREEYRRWRDEQRGAADTGPQPDKPRDEPPPPPKESV